MILVAPARAYLDSYAAALRTGWSHDNVRGEAAAREQLEAIAEDPDAFIASLDDPAGKAGPIRLPDGSTTQRLPGFYRWMWDGEFCGSLGFRWQPGTEALPPLCLGHIGYAVVPWKRRRGHATQGLKLLLPEVAALGLRYVELTTDEDNVPSRRVVEACGGILVERFNKPAVYGGAPSVRYRIPLAKS